MPPRRAVELRVGGQTYRVVATGDDHRVQHLAELVDRKFAEVVPHGLGRNVTAQQAMFLTAMALAAEVEEARSRAQALEGERDRSLRVASRARDVVTRLLERVDGALASVPSPTPAAPPVAESRPSREARFPSPPPRTTGAIGSADAHDASPDDDVIDDDALLDDASPLDRLTDPPDAIHEPLLIDLMTPPPPTLRQSSPVNTTRSAGAPKSPEPRAPLSLEPRAPLSLEPRAPKSPEPAASKVPAPAHRGGLRLVRQAGSPPDDDTR
ncbi:MAG: cell division protein ZapA [Polyangiaceae bacterium]